MIKIPTISEDNSKKYLKDTFKRMKKFLESALHKPEYHQIINFLSTDDQLDDRKIKQLLIGNIEELMLVIQNIGKITSATVIQEFKQLYVNFTNRNLGKEWSERIGVTVCPYCNRSYIFTLRKNGVRPQYDHYFPKSLYPYLSLSMYNLIPSCAICNGAKHDFDTFDREQNKENFIYPFRDSYGTNIIFQTHGSNDVNGWLGNSTEYNLQLVAKEDSYLKVKQHKTTEILNLLLLYSKHSDYVRDIIKVTYIYNSNYCQDLLQKYPELFKNVQEVESLAYMSYLDEENWDKRVLAKLTHDIRLEYK